MICHQSDGAGFFVSFPPVTTMWWGASITANDSGVF